MSIPFPSESLIKRTISLISERYLHCDSSRLSYIILDAGWLESLKLLIFVNSEPNPRFVAKLAREPDNLRNSLTTLTYLRNKCADKSLLRTIPIAVFDKTDGIYVLLEQAMNGVIIRPSSPSDLSKHLKIATAWATKFQFATASYKPVNLCEWIHEDLLIIDHAKAQFRNIVDLQLIHQVSSTIEKLIPYVNHATIYHGDYSWDNILIDGASVSGVVDWAYSRVNAPPGLDLFYYMFYHLAFLYGRMGSTPSMNVSPKFSDVERTLDNCYIPATLSTLGLDPAVHVYPLLLVSLLRITSNIIVSIGRTRKRLPSQLRGKLMRLDLAQRLMKVVMDEIQTCSSKVT